MSESVLTQALHHVGYELVEGEALEQQVINCFLDMVDGGIYSNLDRDEAREEIEAGEITLNHICKALKRL